MHTSTQPAWLALSLLLALSCKEGPGPGPGPEPEPDPDVVEIPDLPQQPSVVHGMLIVGEDKLFLSHLPLYFNPHDFQILLEVELNADDKAAYVADRQANPQEGIYSYVPAPFRLNALADSLRAGTPFPITTTIFRGHFERGGDPFLFDVPSTITRAFLFEQLDANEDHPAESRYFIFGDQGQNFIAHDISGRPDFDHVLSVNAPEGLVGVAAKELVISEQSDTEPLSEGQTFTATANGQSFTLTADTEFYLEFGDLSF